MNTIRIFDLLKDGRTSCISMIGDMELHDYTNLTDCAFENNGGIEGQRGVISRSSVAYRIRERMASDFADGAVLPPVVLGIVVEPAEFEILSNLTKEKVEENLLNKILVSCSQNIAIIDGMQRTNIYRTFKERSPERKIRFEIWISSNINKLIYRMLVLNTGQVPWSVRRQLEVVYKPFIEMLEKELYQFDLTNIPLPNLISVNDQARRTKFNEYHKNTIIELFIAFNMRSEKIDIHSELAENFYNLDMADSLNNDRNFSIFVEVFNKFFKIDYVISLQDHIFYEESDSRYKSASSLFSSQPLRVGFFAAAAQYILGSYKRDYSIDESDARFEHFSDKCDQILSSYVEHIGRYDTGDYDALNDFYSIERLHSQLRITSKSKIGDAERKGFKRAFEDIFEEKNQFITFEPYWRFF